MNHYEIYEKPSALTKDERSRLNTLWNKATRLSKAEYAEMKRLEKRIR